MINFPEYKELMEQNDLLIANIDCQNELEMLKKPQVFCSFQSKNGNLDCRSKINIHFQFSTFTLHVGYVNVHLTP